VSYYDFLHHRIKGVCRWWWGLRTPPRSECDIDIHERNVQELVSRLSQRSALRDRTSTILGSSMARLLAGSDGDLRRLHSSDALGVVPADAAEQEAGAPSDSESDDDAESTPSDSEGTPAERRSHDDDRQPLVSHMDDDSRRPSGDTSEFDSDPISPSSRVTSPRSG
jgi:hypothetical protein